jgi:hypothetical protein
MTYPSRRRKAEIHAAEIERLAKERDVLREVIATHMPSRSSLRDKIASDPDIESEAR